jgi:hypothetical protein
VKTPLLAFGAAFSVILKSKENNSTGTLSLAMRGVKIPKNLQKSTLAFKGTSETLKTINFGGKTQFHTVFLFLERH